MVDPILLVLIMALRTGAVSAKDIQTLVTTTISQENPTIQWTHPEWPLLSQFHNSIGLNVSVPAGYTQIKESLAKMADETGVVEQLWAHDIRRGQALQASRLTSITTRNIPAAAEALNHSNQSITKGITAAYVGANKESTWKARLQDETIDDFDFVLATEPGPLAKRRKPDSAAVDNLLQTNTGLAAYKRPRQQAAKLLQKQAQIDWRLSQRTKQSTSQHDLIEGAVDKNSISEDTVSGDGSQAAANGLSTGK